MWNNAGHVRDGVRRYLRSGLLSVAARRGICGGNEEVEDAEKQKDRRDAGARRSTLRYASAVLHRSRGKWSRIHDRTALINFYWNKAMQRTRDKL